LRFLVDECCPREVAVALRELSHDVLFVADAARGAADESLAALADAQDRIVISEDFDFGELAIRRLSPQTGVVLVFCPGLRPAGRASRVATVVTELDEALRGYLTIVTEDGIRRRAY
jgi:predicted nuclease of predicted toxin-antitoxin system